MTTQQLIDQAFQHGRKNAAYDILNVAPTWEVDGRRTAKEILAGADERLKAIEAGPAEEKPPGA